ncbi:sigma factor-like helix-turn-helix DNA-binding protein [Mycoplasmopsis hyopharyngis]|uniref:sigma factor-like helix-turn-helix DNA-binding protein n=1 Tax=Mycoplasmopsis hyopharyngis TaxID=29558 RepID=UPI0038730D7A
MNKDVRDLEVRELYIELFEKYGSLLTPSQQSIFKLYFYENLSYSEIANIIATTRTSVYDSLKKAMKNLDKYNEKIIS